MPGERKASCRKAAAVERELLDLLAGDDLIDGVGFEFDLRVDGVDGDGFFLLTHLEVRIDGGDAAGRDYGFDQVVGEAGCYHVHFIGAGGERRHAVLTVLIAEQGALERGGRVLHFDGGVGHDTAGRIVDGAGDFAGGRLGRQGRDENAKEQHPQITLHLDIQTQ